MKVSFSYFPKVALDHGGCPSTLSRIFVDYVTISSSSPMQYLRWSSLRQKIGSSWKLLLTVVTESLNVIELLDLTLKQR